jgi:hypothetical protein
MYPSEGRIKSFVRNFSYLNNQSENGSIAHKCRVPSSFPLLIIYQLRLSLSEDLIKNESTMMIPEVGYQKPDFSEPLPAGLTFQQVLDFYEDSETAPQSQAELSNRALYKWEHDLAS